MRKGWMILLALSALASGCHRDHDTPPTTSILPRWTPVSGNIDSDRQLVPGATPDNLMNLYVCDVPVPGTLSCVFPKTPVSVEQTPTQVFILNAKSSGYIVYQASLKS